MNLTSLADVFTREGLGQPPGSNQPFWLDQSDSVWLVQTGWVDMFVVPVSEGESGPRTHFLRAAPGDILFGMSGRGSEPQRFQAVSSQSAGLYRLTRSRLEELCAQKACLDDIARALDRWIQTVYRQLSCGARPQDSQALSTNESVEINPGESAHSSEGVIWVTSLEGRAFLTGIEALSIGSADAPLPLSPDVWIEAVEASTVSCMDTLSGLAQGGLWSGLVGFGAQVGHWAYLKLRLGVDGEAARLERKNQSRQVVVSSAMARLTEPLAERTEKAETLQHSDPLLGACHLVCRALGVTPPQTHVHTDGEPTHALERWARTARLRLRRVILSGDWWREDNGPMLGFIQETNRPVALLPDSPTSYSIADPADQTRQDLTRDLAHSLSPGAYALYRSFPETSPSVWDVFRFGLQNTKEDQRMVLLLSLSAGLLGLAIPLATGLIFDSVIPSDYRSQLWFVAAVLLVAGCSCVIFDVTRGIALLRVQVKSEVAIAGAVWDRLLSLPVPFFRSYSAGDLAVRANGINAIQQIISGAAICSVLGALFSVFNLGLLFVYSVRLAAVAIGLVLLNVAVMLLVSWAELRLQRPLCALQGKLSGQVLQFITGISKLRVAGAEVQAFGLWARGFGEQKRLDLKAGKLANALTVFNESYPVITSMCLFAVVAFGLEPGITTGRFLAFNVAFLGFLYAALSAGGALISMLQAVPIYERARPILQELPEIKAVNADPGDLRGELELTHVSFRYKANGPLILDDLCLHISPGEFVALVGPSGMGKSTVMRLLLGFESPQSGTIRYDGLDLAGLDLPAVRRQLGVVLQNGKLMPGDIFQNIIGSGLFTQEDAWEAARKAGLEQDIQQMPMGMHTVLGETAGTLSGGQRQRLMIARAIVGKPRILLLDEATSALDNRTQAIVAESLKQLQATRLVIAHRLSTVMNADRICVIQQGKVVQSGSYASLIDQPGVFAEFARRQLA